MKTLEEVKLFFEQKTSTQYAREFRNWLFIDEFFIHLYVALFRLNVYKVLLHLRLLDLPEDHGG